MKGFIEDRLMELSRLYPGWEKKTIWEYFEVSSARYPDREFVGAESRESFTYEETRLWAVCVAKGFLAMGVKSGDHVAVQIENCPEQIFVMLALNAIGAVRVPVNTGLSARELEFVLKQSDANYLVTGCKIQLTGENTQLLKAVIMPGASFSFNIPYIEWNDFLEKGNQTEFLPCKGETAADQVCDIIYTSGSTKAPKGVMLTHDMLMRSAYASCLNRGFEIGRRIFVPLPLFHVYGYVEGLLAAIIAGGTIFLRQGKFAAEPVLDYMEKVRANDILSVPSQMITLIRFLKEKPRKFPELHAVYCSASICPAWVWTGIGESFEVDDVITGYGMTEVCGASLQTSPSDGDEILCSRVGKLLPGGCAGETALGGHEIEYLVVDQKTGKPCAAEEIGELWCRGLVVTRGYYNRPEANKRVFTADGWFKTGDSGYFDKDGYLVMAGRIDDMYKINGENVSPKFLEDVLGNCPQIQSVEVVGVPDEKHGHIGMAFLQLREDTAENRLLAEEYSRMHLAKFQVPRYFIYMNGDDWPRTATGKVQTFRLKEMATEKKAEFEKR